MILVLICVVLLSALVSGFHANSGRRSCYWSSLSWTLHPSMYSSSSLTSSLRIRGMEQSEYRVGRINKYSGCRLSMSIPGTVPREVLFEPGNVQILRFLGKIDLSISADRLVRTFHDPPYTNLSIQSRCHLLRIHKCACISKHHDKLIPF